MEASTLHGIWTGVLIAVFVGIVLWAWGGRRRADFERAARIPLDDEAAPARDAGESRDG